MNTDFQKILKRIAAENNTTPEDVPSLLICLNFIPRRTSANFKAIDSGKHQIQNK